LTKEELYWLPRRKVDNKLEKQCTQCKEWLEETATNFYYKNKKKPALGFVAWCKKCNIKLTQKNYDLDRRKELNYGYYHNDEEYRLRQIAYAQTPEYRKGQSAWRKKNPERCREHAKNHRNHDITDVEWNDCLKSFSYKCAYCGITEEESLIIHKQRLHKEHSDDDGYNDLRNAIPACRSCNSSKHQDDMEMWFRKQKFFSIDRLIEIIWWTSEGYKDYIEDKPPYRIIREKNKENRKYHFNLWSVDEMRNTLEIIATKTKKKDLRKDVDEYLKLLSNK